jgi:MoxR-like ATPase
MFRTSQAASALRGREEVIPDAVKALVKATLTHRIMVAPAARVRGATAGALLEEVLERVPVPKAWVGSRSSCVPGRGPGRTTRISSGQESRSSL